MFYERTAFMPEGQILKSINLSTGNIKPSDQGTNQRCQFKAVSRLIGTTCVEINLGKIFFAKKQGFAVTNIVELL